MTQLKDKIRTISDFPQPGIQYRDITTLIKDGPAFRQVIDLFYERFKDQGIDYIAAIESRGYLFGAPLAYKLGAGLVIIRKPGKLPAAVERIEYALEYGTDALEIHRDAVEAGKKVLVIDDLLATGGTISAACQLIKNIGGNVIAAAFVIELPELNGRQNLPTGLETYSLFEF